MELDYVCSVGDCSNCMQCDNKYNCKVFAYAYISPIILVKGDKNMMPIKCAISGIGCPTCGRKIGCPDYIDFKLEEEKEMKHRERKSCYSEENCKCCPDKKECPSYDEKDIDRTRLHCRGQGFNCPTCHKKASCPEYIEVPNHGFSGTLHTVSEGGNDLGPIGVEPINIWLTKRFTELKRAITDFTNDDKEVPTEWITEYNELASRILK